LKLVEEVSKVGGEIFGEESVDTIKACMQCGKCTGSCPSGRITALRTRKIFLMAQLDLREELLSSDELWLCTTCYTCYERCPRGVKTTDIIRTLRNIAAKEGHMSLSHRKVASYAINTGHTVPVTGKWKREDVAKMRENLGLEPVAPTTQRYEDQLKQLQTIIRTTGFDALVDFDWEQMDIREIETEGKGGEKK
jgi:heterodisulfide reductase subunit C